MQDQKQGADPEDRAFTGAPDMPPQQPDQTSDGNEALNRPDAGQPDEEQDDKGEGGEAGNPHGDYPSLPGYGG